MQCVSKMHQLLSIIIVIIIEFATLLFATIIIGGNNHYGTSGCHAMRQQNATIIVKNHYLQQLSL